MNDDIRDIDDTLIGIVYDTAADPTFWPVILEGLNSVISGGEEQFISGAAPSTRASSTESFFSSGANAPLAHNQPVNPSTIEQADEQRLISRLTPHIKRAFDLNQKLTRAEDERDLLQDLYDQLPFGVLIIDESEKILNINKRASEMIASSTDLRIENHRLCTTDERLRSTLSSLVRHTDRRSHHATHSSRFELRNNRNDPSVTVIIGPERSHELSPLGRRRIRTLFLCAERYESMLSLKQLTTLYGLTEREAHVARQIACGLSTHAIADRDGVKVATVRDQLKTIYEKTGAHSQNKLAFMILTNPAVWKTAASPPPFVPTTFTEPGYFRESSITLSDGRTLSYAEYGALSGFPVFWMHSLWGGRYERFPYDRLTAQHGIRLIIPDRPGFGRSTYMSGHSYAQWGKDFVELIDALGIDECSIISMSASSYALGCAYVAPQRLRRVLLHCPWSPIDSLKDVLKMPTQYKFLIGLGLYMPSLAKKFIQLHMSSMCRQPRRLFHQIVAHAPAIDERMLRDPRIEGIIATSIFEWNGRSCEGLVDEFCKVIAPWDLPISDITLPIDIMVGDQGHEMHVHMAHKLARLLPDAQVHKVPNAGVFCIFSHWSDALKAAVTQHKSAVVI